MSDKEIIKPSDVQNKDFFIMIEDIVICPMCKGIIIQPTECTTCNAVFCYECITSWQNTTSICPNQCPNLTITQGPDAIYDLLAKLIFSSNMSYDEKIQEVIQDSFNKPKASNLFLGLRLINKTIIYHNGNEYSGEYAGKGKNGYGIFRYEQGDIYEGYWLNDKKHGKGKYTFASGDSYFGEWIDNKRHGFGKLLYQNGSYYEGYWANDKINGKGKHKYQSENYYEGEWVNNHKEGFGFFRYSNENYYEGFWKNNQRNGFGKYVCAKSKYEGQWVHGKYEGYGEIIFQSGNIYKGYWKNNKKNGFGIYYFANGNKCEGDWVNDSFDGYGIYSTKKMTYEGYYKNGKRHGKGKLTKAKSIYNGEWNNNVIEGYGYYISSKIRKEGYFKDGKFIKGEIISDLMNHWYYGDVVDDKRQGYGIYSDLIGKQYKGEWQNNQKAKDVFTSINGIIYDKEMIINTIYLKKNK